MDNMANKSYIVRMSNGALVIFSPTALTPEVRKTLDNLGGNVKYIAAPDIEHHIFVGEWAKAFPAAHVIGVDGLPEKREKSAETQGTKFSHVFTKENKLDLRIDADFDKDFDYEFVHSHGNKEFVINYRPDRTLIQADLIWNLPAKEQYSKSGESPTAGIWTKLFASLLTLDGTAKAQKRFLWYALSAGDRKGFNESMHRINNWDFDRIIPCHGDVVETGGKGIFEKVMQWHLEAKP